MSFTWRLGLTESSWDRSSANKTCYHNSEDCEKERWLSNGDIFSEMTRKKKNTVYRRKRKGNPSLQFRYTRKKWRKRPPIGGEIPEATPGICEQLSSDSENSQSLRASLLKMEPEDYSDGCSECSDDKTACLGEGYRLTDLKKQWRNCLQHCPKLIYVCEKGEKYWCGAWASVLSLSNVSSFVAVY